MLVSVLLALQFAATTPTAVPPESTTVATTTDTTDDKTVDDHLDGIALSVEPVLQLSARGAASRVDTSMTTWLGVRVGVIANDAAGPFVGADAAVLVGAEGAGTNEVKVTRAPAVVDVRGLAGWRWLRGFVGLAGYGYVGGAVGGGTTTTQVFDDKVDRGFFTLGATGGVGLETTFGIGLVRLETGVGVRDAHVEMHGTFAAGVRF